MSSWRICSCGHGITYHRERGAQLRPEGCKRCDCAAWDEDPDRRVAYRPHVGTGNGRHAYGEDAPGAKLTEAQVIEIRRRRAAADTINRDTLQAIANDYGVTRELIRLIVARKVWKHVP
jgi:hypothetical protein